MTQPKPRSLEVKVSVMETGEFKGVVRLIADVYAMSDGPTKQYIETELRRIIGQTHSVDSALKG